MKFKSVFAALIAAISFWACVEENPISQFTGMDVSSDYIALPAAGGSAEFTVTAEEDWTVKIDEAGSKWLTVVPASGKAGETVKVTVSAPMATASRKASVSLVTSSKTKIVTVAQQGDPNAVSTCKDVMEGKDGTTYRVKGKVTSIVNTEYGNLYINDGTVEGDGVYIYGVKNDKLQYPKDAEGGWDSFGIHAGDVITVKGPRKTYNGTVELVDVEVISVEAGTDPIMTVDTNAKTVAFSETSVEFDLTVNNLTAKWTVTPSETYSWVTINTPEGTTSGKISFTLEANSVAEDRTATFTVQSAGAKDIVLTITQLAYQENGTADKPYTVAEAMEVINGLEDGAKTPTEVYVKAIIASIKEVSTSYGNATFNISDNGVDENAITVFRCKYLEGASFTAEDQIAVGDIVVLKGQLQKYVKNEVMTPQMAQNTSIVKIDRPLTVAQALAEIDKMEDGKTADDQVYVMGVVTGANGIDTGYGNATFKIIDAGVADKTITVFRAKDFDNQKFTSTEAFKEGDTVILIGQLQRYVKDEVMTPELSKGWLVGVIPGAAPVAAGITIDGNLSDWEDIDACASTGTSRIRSWKFATDANNLYFYLVMRKNRMRTEYGVTLAFDWDESGSLSADNLSGAEAVVVFQPFTNPTSGTPTCVNGAVTTAKVNGTEGTTVSINVYGVDPDTSATGDSADYILELSIPRSDIPGLPASGTAIKIGIGYEWYKTDFQSVTL